MNRKFTKQSQVSSRPTRQTCNTAILLLKRLQERILLLLAIESNSTRTKIVEWSIKDQHQAQKRSKWNKVSELKAEELHYPQARSAEPPNSAGGSGPIHIVGCKRRKSCSSNFPSSKTNQTDVKVGITKLRRQSQKGFKDAGNSLYSI